MLKMTMHCDHAIFRRYSKFRFSLVPTHTAPMAIMIHAVFRSMTVFFMCLVPIFLLTTIV